jgi:uncharacterized protein YvpB
MTEKEFLTVYTDRLIAFINLYKNELKNLSSESSQIIIERIDNHNSLIIEKGNLLISDILLRNNINPDSSVITSDLSDVTLSSLLAQKTFTVQIEVRGNYNGFSNSILSEALCRDFPEDCLEDL